MSRRIPTRLGLLARARRWLLLRWLTWQADCVRAERQQYEAAGVVGPVYLRNSWLRELELRFAARRTELSK